MPCHQHTLWLASLGAALSLFACSAAFAQTEMLGGTPTRTNVVPVDFGEVHLAWDVDLGDRTNGSAPVVDEDGASYWVLRAGLLKLGEDGQEKWRAPLSNANASPTLAGNIVVVQTLDGAFIALDTETGEERWRVSTRLGRRTRIASSPLFDQATGRIFATVESRVVGIDTKTGRLKVIFDTGDRAAQAHGSLALASNGTLLVSNWNGSIWGIDTEGVEQWKVFGLGKRLSAPIVANDTVYVVSNTTLYALSLQGQRLWQRRVHGINSRRFLSALSDGRVIVPLNRGVVAIGDRGRVSWVYHGKRGPVAPLVTDRHSQVWTSDGSSLVVLSPSGQVHRMRTDKQLNGAVAFGVGPTPTVFVSAGERASAFRSQRYEVGAAEH